MISRIGCVAALLVAASSAALAQTSIPVSQLASQVAAQIKQSSYANVHLDSALAGSMTLLAIQQTAAAALPASKAGAANGVATLGATGTIPASQLLFGSTTGTVADGGVLTQVSSVASAALPKSGGVSSGPITSPSFLLPPDVTGVSPQLSSSQSALGASLNTTLNLAGLTSTGAVYAPGVAVGAGPSTIELGTTSLTGPASLIWSGLGQHGNAIITNDLPGTLDFYSGSSLNLQLSPTAAYIGNPLTLGKSPVFTDRSSLAATTYMAGGLVDAEASRATGQEAAINAIAVAAYPALTNPLNTSAGAANLGTPCAGNSGVDGYNIANHQFAYGVACSYTKPPAPIQFGGTGGYQYPQTYAWQVGLELPSLPSNPNVVPSGTISTDQVAFYPEARGGAWSPSFWAENPLIALNKDSGGGIISEMDLNNFEGCDTPGIDVDASSTGGSNPFVSLRSDGSKCPGAIGLLVTGVGNRISGSAIAISGVSNSAGDMWQDGLTMIGGYLINEADISENTGAHSVLKAEGVHTRGIDLASGHFGFAAIGLADSVDGSIVWECPTGAPANSLVKHCVTGYPPSGMFIYPYSDGSMHFSSGAPWQYDGATIFIGPETNKSLITAQAGITASIPTGPAVVATSIGGPAITATTGSGYAITADTHGIQSAGPVQVGSIVPYATGAPLQVGTLSGAIFPGAVQLLSLTYSQLVVGCTTGQMVFVSDGRKPSEAAGAGTGSPVVCTPTTKGGSTMAWYSVFSGTPVGN
jgi:hypothetical protein